MTIIKVDFSYTAQLPNGHWTKVGLGVEKTTKVDASIGDEIDTQYEYLANKVFDKIDELIDSNS